MVSIDTPGETRKYILMHSQFLSIVIIETKFLVKNPLAIYSLKILQIQNQTALSNIWHTRFNN